MYKKVVSLSAALALALGGLSALPFEGVIDTAVTARAEETLTYGDFEYTVLDDGTVEISYYGSSDKTVTIPSTIDGKKVTSIQSEAIFDCKNLTSITIPDSVTSIYDNAFFHCTELLSINVDANNKKYSSNNGVLYNKDMTEIVVFPKGKTSVTIPGSVKRIGKLAFSNNKELTKIKIPDSVTSIGEQAFFCCENLKSVTIPDSVTNIGELAFDGCFNLRNVTISSGITSIGNFVFGDCHMLSEVTIPNSVTTIGNFAFDGCSSLTSITIPDSVTSIGVGAFAFCTDITNITIPNSVTSIGEWAFGECTSLTSITIPNSVTSIGKIVFQGCDSDNLVVNCYSGSVAEKYAKENGIKYKLLAAKGISSLSVKADKTVFGYTGKAKAPTVTIKDGSYTLKQGTDYTLSYKNNKNIGTGTITVTGKGDYTGTKTLSFTIIPSNVGGFRAASTSASAVKLSWNKVSGAQGYIVYQYNTSTKKWVRIAKTGNVNTYTVKSLKAGTTYKYAIKAYKTVSGKDYTSAKYPTITTSTKPAKVSFKATAASKAVKFSWSKVAGATNYIVYYRVKGTSSWKSVKVANNVTSKTISGLVKGKTYEVTVKAVRTVNKVNYNGAYDVKTVKVK